MCFFAENAGLALSNCGRYFVSFAVGFLAGNCIAFASEPKLPGEVVGWLCCCLSWAVTVEQEV